MKSSTVFVNTPDLPGYIKRVCLMVMAVSILVCSCGGKVNMTPYKTVTLREYIDYGLGQNMEIPDPIFPGSLGVEDVILETRYSGAYNPDKAFKDDYIEELTVAGVQYFKRVGMCRIVKRGTGDMSLLIKIKGFNARSDYIPQQLTIKVETLLYKTANQAVLLSFKQEVGVMVELDRLHETVFLPGFRGGKGIHMKHGPVQMGEISLRLFKGIFDAAVKNKSRIMSIKGSME